MATSKLIEVDVLNGDVVRTLGEWASFADTYAYATTRLGLDEMPDISQPGVWLLEGDHAIIIQVAA